MENQDQKDIINNYLTHNKATWDAWTDINWNSAFYDNETFLKTKDSLKDIEKDLIGDVTDLSIIHLQCHYGQDSISLAQRGAQVKGLDLSPKAIQRAKELAERCERRVDFVCSDVYSAPQVLNETFDRVFTTYGTIGWLPDLQRWAKVIAKLLKPGGKLIFAEFHPLVWMFDYDFTKVEHKYNDSPAIVETLKGNYSDRNAGKEQTMVSWNHGLADVVQALIQAGLRIDDFREYDYSPHACFKHVYEFEPGKWRVKPLKDLIPYVYSIVASKPSL